MKFTVRTRLWKPVDSSNYYCFYVGQPEFKEWAKDMHLVIGQRIWCNRSGQLEEAGSSIPFAIVPKSFKTNIFASIENLSP